MAGTVLVLLAGAAGCTAQPDDEPPAEAAATGAVVTVTATVTATAAPVPAAPDPAAPDPAAPDPAAPDPAASPRLTVAAARTPSPTALACTAVQEALTDAVARYEVQALAEDGLGSGDRAAAGEEMTAAMDRAVREAGRVPGLAVAAAPAVAELGELRDGMAVREDLDEDDAGPWREARDRLEGWCEARD